MIVTGFDSNAAGITPRQAEAVMTRLPPTDVLPDILTTLQEEVELNHLLPDLVVGEPTALLIDGNNLFKVAQRHGLRIDYGRLYAILAARCDLQIARIYKAIDSSSNQDRKWMRKTKNLGYTFSTKNIKRGNDKEHRIAGKTNMDVEITLGAMNLDPSIRHVILGSCDGDFVALVEDLREKRKIKVSVLGIGSGNSVGMSHALVGSCKTYYDMLSFQDHVMVAKG